MTCLAANVDIAIMLFLYGFLGAQAALDGW